MYLELSVFKMSLFKTTRFEDELPANLPLLNSGYSMLEYLFHFDLFLDEEFP
jgi:hypothetical protein